MHKLMVVEETLRSGKGKSEDANLQTGCPGGCVIHVWYVTVQFETSVIHKPNLAPAAR